MKLYVKKVWSYNPTKYKYIPLEKAIKGYDDYLNYYRENTYRDLKFIKSFDRWLRTEI